MGSFNLTSRHNTAHSIHPSPRKFALFYAAKSFGAQIFFPHKDTRHSNFFLSVLRLGTLHFFRSAKALLGKAASTDILMPWTGIAAVIRARG